MPVTTVPVHSLVSPATRYRGPWRGYCSEEQSLGRYIENGSQGTGLPTMSRPADLISRALVVQVSSADLAGALERWTAGEGRLNLCSGSSDEWQRVFPQADREAM